MKLRNKKTGEIVERVDITIREVGVVFNNDETYNSLTELNEAWEDYEEPKDERWYWCVDYITCGVDHLMYDPDDPDQDEFNKSIGNYFDTREEAELAVEKLKAWKRLKDKGFRFDCYMRRSDWAGLSEVKALENLIDITAYLPKDKIKEMEADLDLLFGGEE